MKTLDEVLKEANAAYDKHMKENPGTWREEHRPSFVLGWLGSSYERLYEESKSNKNMNGEQIIPPITDPLTFGA